MPVPTDITAGALTITNGSTAVTGAGTSWLASDLRQGDLMLWIEGGDGFWQPILRSVESNTALTLEEPWEGPTLTGARYRIRYQWDSSRVSAQSRQLIELLDNGNLLAFSALTGPGVAVFNGPHSIVIKPETDFINGVSFDVQVDTLPDRAAYDGQSAGFTVLVADVGDGRSAVYSKNSNTSADWSDPAYITGPVGPMPLVEAGTITTGAPGTDYEVTIDPITGGYEINFTIPAPPGFYWENAYNPANTYPVSSVVRLNGSSFIAAQAVPIATPPSGAFPPVDTAYWEVLASRGANGSGTGIVETIVEGSNITVDDSDPANPIVSSTIPDGDKGDIIVSGGGVVWRNKLFPSPGGRITLTSGQPVQTANAVAATFIYYTPDIGNRYPLWDGVSAFVSYDFAELALSLASAYHLADNTYDLLIVRSGGNNYLATGPAWASANSRGTGPGSAEIETINGIHVNKNAITVRPENTSSGTTIAVPARMGTVVGCVRTTANGQTEYTIAPTPAAGGNNNKIYVRNFYNKRSLVARSIDSTSTWVYATNTIRAMNGSNNNRISFVNGDPSDTVEARLASMVLISTVGAFPIFGIALDATGAFASESVGARAQAASTNASSSAELFATPGLGLHYVQAVEQNLTALGASYLGGDQFRFTAKLLV